MERTPTKEQSRFGPAQSRAQVFSIFSPTNPDMSKADAFQDLSDIASMGASYASEKEQRDAMEERDAGMREYAAGLVEDGQRIRDGELEPIESRYYMAGVEMGQGRRRGREVWAEFSRWTIDNPRPGLDPEEDYNEWIANGLATAQETLGYDPSSMSQAELGEYSAVVNQIRQRDSEEFVAQMNQEAIQGQIDSISSDIVSLGQGFDPATPDAIYEDASNIVALARVQGLDLEAVRGEMITQFANMSREHRDISILKNIPQGFLRSAASNARLQNVIDTTESQIDQDNWDGQYAVIRGIQEFIQAGDLDSAAQGLAAAEEADEIPPGAANTIDARIHSEHVRRGQAAAREADRLERQRLRDIREAQRVAERARRTAERLARASAPTAAEIRRQENQHARLAATLDAVSSNTGAAGTTYLDVYGDTQAISPRELALEYQNHYVRQSGGLTAEVLSQLSTVSEQTGMVFPAVDNFVNSALNGVPIAALEGDNLTGFQQAQVDFTMQMDQNTLAAYVDDPEDLAAIQTAQFLAESGQYSPAEALGVSRRISGTVAETREHRRWSNNVLRQMDDASTFGGGVGPFSPDPTDVMFSAFGIEIPSWNRRRNLDADDPDGVAIRYSAEIGDVAARIEQAAGRAAAEEYVEDTLGRTMIVNRMPVRPVGLIGGFEGGTFLNEVLVSVGVADLAPQLEFAYEENLWNQITGTAGEWNPNDPEMVAIFTGRIDTTNVEGGVVFSIDGASSFHSTEELNARFTTWSDQQALDAAADEQAAFDNTRDIEYQPPRPEEAIPNLDRIMDARYAPIGLRRND